MKTVPETVQPLCPRPLDLGRKSGESRMRIVRREELSEPREPARLLEMQIGDQQRLLGRPEECAVSAWAKRLARERKGNHGAGLTPGRWSGYSQITRNRRPKESVAAERRRSGAAP